MTIYSLNILLFLFGASLLFLSSSNCCFLMCIQFSQEAGQAVWYSHLFQKYVNCEIPDVQTGFRKGRGTRDQIANICWVMEKAREFQKNIHFCLIDYTKAFECVDHNKL